jgi:tRNA pseudouridine55 synthase
MDGFLLINKKKDWTSRDVCNKVARILKTKKVGHNGTLDPFATGLMLVALGKATKALPYVEFNYKTYIAELKLGQKTSTDDNTSEIIEEKPVPNLTKEEIIEALNSFLGESEQLPPMTSAIHVNGVKLYELAHKGIEIDRPKRKINVLKISLISYKDNILLFKCLVSTGTYIRVLGSDIAQKLGTVGHLTNLTRVSFKDDESIKINEAIEIEEVDETKIKDVSSFIPLPKIFADEKMEKDVLNGRELSIKSEYDKILILKENTALAVYKRSDKNKYCCERGLW